MQVTPGRLLEAWAALQPDVMTLLTDELPAVAGGNRRKAAGQRSMRWLDACLRGAAEAPALRDISCLVSTWSACSALHRKAACPAWTCQDERTILAAG